MYYKDIKTVSTHCAAVRVTFELSNWKLAHWLLLYWGTFSIGFLAPS